MVFNYFIFVVKGVRATFLPLFYLPTTIPFIPITNNVAALLTYFDSFMPEFLFCIFLAIIFTMDKIEGLKDSLPGLKPVKI